MSTSYAFLSFCIVLMLARGVSCFVLRACFVAYARNTSLLPNMIDVGFFYAFLLDVRNLTENIKGNSNIVFLALDTRCTRQY